MPAPSAPATHAPSTAVEHGVTFGQLEKNLVFGLLVGTPVMYVTVVLLCTLAGLDLPIALSVALLPGAFGGLFFVGILPLLRECGRQEHLQQEAWSAAAVTAAPLAVGADEVPVAPAVV